MSDVHESETGTTAGEGDRSQFFVAGLIAVIGLYTIYNATTLDVGFADPVGPRVFPFIVGTALVVLSVMLTIATLRGDAPEAADGEDIDLTTPADTTTLIKLVAVMAFTILTIGVLGWAISGALLFAGAAWSLGSRTTVRDLAIGIVMSVGSWYGFYSGLGVPLPAGLLDGIL